MPGVRFNTISRLVVLILFTLSFGPLQLHSAETFEAGNELKRALPVTVYCSDNTSCLVVLKGGETTQVELTASVTAIEVGGIFVSSGNVETVELNNNTTIVVDFSESQYAGIFEDDCGN